MIDMTVPRPSRVPRLLRVTAIAAAIAFVLAGSGVASQQAEAAALTSTYVNKDFGVSFKYPKAWKLSITSDNSSPSAAFLTVDLATAAGESMGSVLVSGPNGSGGTCNGTISLHAFGAKNVTKRAKSTGPKTLAGLFYLSNATDGFKLVRFGLLSVYGNLPSGSKWTRTLPCDTQTANPVFYKKNSQLLLSVKATVPPSVTTLAQTKKYAKTSTYRAQLKFLKSVKVSTSIFD